MRRIPAFVIALACLVLELTVMVTVGSLLARAEPPALCFDRETNDNRTSDAADFLTGQPDDDVAALGDGGDQYFATTGDDVVCGNADDDVVVGEEGADFLDGGGGSDVVSGMVGSDVVKGGAGTDTVQGGSGADIVRAGPGDGVHDELFDGPGEDTIVGGVEDTWFKCADEDPDDHEGFAGDITGDPDC